VCSSDLTIDEYSRRAGEEIGGVSHLKGIVEQMQRIYIEQGPAAGRAKLDDLAANAPESSGFSIEVATKGFIDELDAELTRRAKSFVQESEAPAATRGEVEPPPPRGSRGGEAAGAEGTDPVELQALRFAFASCQQYEQGWFSALRHIAAEDVDCIYELPLKFHAEGLDQKVVELLNIWTRAPVLDGWEAFMRRVRSLEHDVTIGIVGKYVDLKESYKSLNEALFAGGVHNNARVNLKFIDSELLEKQGLRSEFVDVDGILVPGGFGSRGIEGKIKAVQYARENRVPYFGICLGMQMAVTEFARNVCGLEGASSTEFNPDTPHPVIHLMDEQRAITDKGGTMRLGAYQCELLPESRCLEIYEQQVISERHRHRYEFNSAYREELAAKGLKPGGLSPDGRLVELVEYSDHPWFIGCQFHPEFKSKPMKPHPLFRDFIAAALAHQKKG